MTTRQVDSRAGEGIGRFTRGAALFLLPFLITAGVLLYLFPLDTERLFAWPVAPAMTALMMGAGYLSGVYFFTRVALADRWSRVAAGYLPVAVFAWMLLVASLIHWDRFSHDHLSFYAWFGLYLLTPLLVPALWLANRRREKVGEQGESHSLPRRAALVFALIGVVQVAAGLLLFLAPQTVIPLWPWALTPLTTRVLGGWFVLAGLSDLGIGLVREWGRVKIVLETQLIGLALILLAVPRALGDYPGGAAAYLPILAGFILLFAWGTGVYLFMARSGRRLPAGT